MRKVAFPYHKHMPHFPQSFQHSSVTEASKSVYRRNKGLKKSLMIIINLVETHEGLSFSIIESKPELFLRNHTVNM